MTDIAVHIMTTERKRTMKKVLLAFITVWCVAVLAGPAQAQTPEPPAQPPPAPAAAPAPATPAATSAIDGDLKAIAAAPKPEDKAKGDPAGTITGTAADIPVGDAKAGLTIADVVNAVGQNLIATNFVWTLVTGFLVMFMQAGFAIVETGLARAKNANHTMMMNFMVYGVGMLAYWLIGFAIQEGGVGAVANLGGTAPLSSEFAVQLFGKSWGLFGQNGIMLGGATYDVGVMVMFLFQMVFMDTALTIVTGTAAERWKYSAFVISSFFMGAFTYPLYGNWAWGGGWLATLGSSYGLGHGYADFAGSGVVHAVGGITALAMAIIIGPRIGKFRRDGTAQRDARPRHHHRAARLLHPGVRLVRIQPGLDAGRGRQRQPPHQLHRREHHAGRHGRIVWRDVLHVDPLRQTGRVHDRQRAPRGSGGHHGAQRVRQSDGLRDHRPRCRRPCVPLGRIRRAHAEIG